MPQLNPEFFISQLFWLVITFGFLFIFLWRVSLPRIGDVLEKRANKISMDIKIAKKHQAEAEDIEKNIDNQLRDTKINTSNLIKEANQKFQDQASKEIEKIDVSLNKKLDEVSLSIEESKIKSIDQINSQIYDITKLTIAKISNIKTEDEEIKQAVNSIQNKVIN